MSEIDRVRGLLQLARTAFPAPSTLWWSFERVPTRIWRQLLRRSATHCDPDEHGALDATFFDREAASSHYVDRLGRHIRTPKTTALVDTESCAVLDLHCSAHWPHDTQVGRQVALRNTADIETDEPAIADERPEVALRQASIPDESAYRTAFRLLFDVSDEREPGFDYIDPFAGMAEEANSGWRPEHTRRVKVKAVRLDRSTNGRIKLTGNEFRMRLRPSAGAKN